MLTHDFGKLTVVGLGCTNINVFAIQIKIFMGKILIGILREIFPMSQEKLGVRGNMFTE